MKKAPIVAVAAIVVLALFGSGLMLLTAKTPDDTTPSPEGSPQVDAPYGSWILKSWSSQVELPADKITMNVESGKVSGVSACNNYNGPIEIDQESFSTGLFAQTMMFCEDVDEAERTYLELLDSVTSWTVDGELILSSEGTEVLRFSRA
ncbi:MAG: META domain-containing protein [Propionibacteriaceae bacterium]|nr:META domain-containing protein [Propionibacteriaceae bacterium]